MKKLPKKLIMNLINEGHCVQVACTYSNICRWQHLTISGQVCRESYGFVEDSDAESVFDLPVMTWNSVKRLQRALANLQQ